MATKKKITYEELIPILRHKHFYPKQPTTAGKITSLQIDCPPILRDSRKAVLEEVLKDYPVKIEFMGNGHDYLLITLPKK